MEIYCTNKRKGVDITTYADGRIAVFAIQDNEYWFTIGWYKTINGAIIAAKMAMKKHGYTFGKKAFSKLNKPATDKKQNSNAATTTSSQKTERTKTRGQIYKQYFRILNNLTDGIKWNDCRSEKRADRILKALHIYSDNMDEYPELIMARKAEGIEAAKLVPVPRSFYTKKNPHLNRLHTIL